jgi:hypothetical protein
VQKAVELISADNAKLAAFCRLATLDEQMAKADQAGDTKKLDDLGKQANDLQNGLGPDHLKLNVDLDQADPRSQHGQDLLARLEAHDKTRPR